MPGKRLLIESTPTSAEFQRTMRIAAKNIANFSLMMRQAAVLFDRWVQMNFRSEGGSVGGWLPLKAGGRWKNGKFDVNAKILQDEGRLRGSFLRFSDSKNAGIGSEIPYSIYHEKGTRRLPVRRMLPEENDVKAEVTRLFEYHVKKSANDAGLKTE